MQVGSLKSKRTRGARFKFRGWANYRAIECMQIFYVQNHYRAESALVVHTKRRPLDVSLNQVGVMEESPKLEDINRVAYL